MSNRKNVVKFKKRKNMNIGIIIFLILFVYLSIKVFIYFTNDQITIYEVHEGETTPEETITGLVLRDEKVVNSDKAGYISYFQKEGERVQKKAPTYAVNENQQVADALENSGKPIALTQEDYAEVSYDFLSFQKSFSNDNFASVYDFKEDAQSTVLDLLNSAMLDQGQAIQEKTGSDYSYKMYKSKHSGIISYYVDSFENVTKDDVTKAMFQKKDYKRNSLRTMNMVPKGSPVYKLITSDQWFIILPLTAKQYSILKGKNQIGLTITKDDFKTSAGLSLFQKGENDYAALSLNKYGSSYLRDRYLDVNLEYQTEKGLKIPKTSVLKKKFYMVPLKYLTNASDHKDKKSIVTKTYTKTGDAQYKTIDVDIYYMDDKYAYIDSNLAPVGTEITCEKDQDSYKLTRMDTLTGVYCVNTGYAVFRKIEIIEPDNEYYIIKKDTAYGVSAYDHIALNSNTAVEQKIIY